MPPADDRTLLAHLRRRIALAGPLTVADYMAEALGHPQHGYYRTRDPLGAAGDFVTAPEISQMFGELIGLWAAVVWQSAGAPDPLHFVELGPGRGTLAVDAARAAKRVPGFAEAVRLHLVETSPVLRRAQEAALAGSVLRHAPRWHDGVETLPEGPRLVVANEFFDALPIRQFQRAADGWRERLVDADAGGGLLFVLGPPRPVEPLVPLPLRDAAVGAVVEASPAAIGLMAALAGKVAAGGIAALIVDYGHAASGAGDTLQAVHRHAFADVLAEPGEADLTAHVDFAALARVAAEAGCAVHGPVGQGAFLNALGIAERAAVLARSDGGRHADAVRAAATRLTAPDAMGTLFKVLAVTAPDVPEPPGFSE
jgi:NADH dehydrogenase [ubiquinone] 1 alpha subcomplex assembly factor 7